MKAAYEVNNARVALCCSCALLRAMSVMRDISAIVGASPKP